LLRRYTARPGTTRLTDFRPALLWGDSDEAAPPEPTLTAELQPTLLVASTSGAGVSRILYAPLPLAATAAGVLDGRLDYGS
jgi:hypothetical protein